MHIVKYTNHLQNFYNNYINQVNYLQSSGDNLSDPLSLTPPATEHFADNTPSPSLAQRRGFSSSVILPPQPSEEQRFYDMLKQNLAAMNLYKAQEYKFSGIAANTRLGTEMFFPPQSLRLFSKDYPETITVLLEALEEQNKQLEKQNLILYEKCKAEIIKTSDYKNTVQTLEEHKAKADKAVAN
jgi:hypothetical protein